MNLKPVQALWLTLLLLLPATSSLFSQEEATSPPSTDARVNLEESIIRVPRVNFLNRNRNRASRAMEEKQRNDGKSLARQVMEQGEGEEGGIEIRRVYNPSEPNLGADLFIIRKEASFSHINGVRRILAAYLQEAFEYSPEDAATLSRFLLYYNARKRGDMEAISKNFSKDVVASLDPRLAGIDRRYYNWPGKTQMLLPLKKSVIRPGETDLDLKEVDKDSGTVPQKEQQKMEQLQENRKKEDLQKLDERESSLNQESTSLKQEESALQKKSQETTQKIQESEQRQTELEKNPEQNRDQIQQEKATQENLKQEQTSTNEQISEVQNRQEEVKQEVAEVRQQRQETTGESAPQTARPPAEPVSQEKVATLVEENRQLKEQIQEQQEKSPNVVGEKILFLRILQYMEGGHYKNELWKIDPVKDDALERGPYTSICGKEFLVVPDAGVLVIGYENESHTDVAHHLILLDQESLALKASTKEEIFWRSPMIFRDNKFYAFEIYEGQHYLSRFNLDMTLDARSSDPISPNSDVTFYKEKIYLTGKAPTSNQTTIRVFSRTNLSMLKTIEP